MVVWEVILLSAIYVIILIIYIVSVGDFVMFEEEKGLRWDVGTLL